MLWHRNKFWLKTFIQGRGEHGNNLKRLQVVCLVQKQWIHSSTSRAWKSESNHMKRPHIKEGTSSNWGRIRRTSLSPNEVLVKTKHFSERYCTFCRTPPCACIQKKSIQNLVHSCETKNSISRLFYVCHLFQPFFSVLRLRQHPARFLRQQLLLRHCMKTRSPKKGELRSEK